MFTPMKLSNVIGLQIRSFLEVPVGQSHQTHISLVERSVKEFSRAAEWATTV